MNNDKICNSSTHRDKVLLSIQRVHRVLVVRHYLGTVSQETLHNVTQAMLEVISDT